MLGAIIGDIVGSRFEWNNIKSKRFDLFTDECGPTDDSIMTLAIAKALLESKGDLHTLERLTIHYMQEIGRQYPDSGYGGDFFKWLFSDEPIPYNSYGNGAAMRVSACGLVASSLKEAVVFARAVTKVTHDHPEGIKGAEATATAIYLAKNGRSISEIRDHIHTSFYPMDFTIDSIRNDYSFDVTCQGTVPQALMAFFESTSFEDAIRNAISIGGDSDTLAAITGGIAEAFYGIPKEIRKSALTFLDKRQRSILEAFEEMYQPKVRVNKTRRNTSMASTNGSSSASIGFEQEIWAAADILRGNMDAAEYKHVVLGLIFLKYISDKFEERYRELEAASDDVEDIDAYAEVNVFYVPPSARWSVISEAAHEEKIGAVIDDAMRSIEKENKRLKDILPKTYARTELDKRRLGNVVDLFTNIQMIEHGTDKDILGRTYEYCLQQFASKEGKRGGEFYTPSCMVRTLVEVLKPTAEHRVYDPCCGSGGMFIQSERFVKAHSGGRGHISIYGQDSNPTTRKLALMNLAIRGIEADLGGYNADTFHNDLHKTLKADFILANPPFNLSDWNDGSLNDDIRWKYGLPPSGNANFAWMQHMIHHLAPNGKIGLVLANGSLSSNTSGEGEIRKRIVQDDLLEGIVAMPPNLFYGVTIPASLWFLARNKKQKGKTLFIDARKMGCMIDRVHRELSEEEIQKIASAFDAFHDGSVANVKGYCAAVSTEEIEKQGCILTPGRYVGIEDQEDDGEPFEEKMTRLTGELTEMFKCSHEIEEEIRKRLGALGYEV